MSLVNRFYVIVFPVIKNIAEVESLLLEQLKRTSELGSGGEGKPAVTARGETYWREEQEEISIFCNNELKTRK
ncbi:hypothetical protein CR513_03573, partial [Mucuna pruriens]